MNCLKCVLNRIYVVSKSIRYSEMVRLELDCFSFHHFLEVIFFFYVSQQKKKKKNLLHPYATPIVDGLMPHLVRNFLPN